MMQQWNPEALYYSTER